LDKRIHKLLYVNELLTTIDPRKIEGSEEQINNLQKMKTYISNELLIEEYVQMIIEYIKPVADIIYPMTHQTTIRDIIVYKTF